MRRRLVRIAVALALLGLLIGGAGTAWVRQRLYTPWSGWQGPAVDVVLEPGLDAGSMLVRLEQSGVLRDARLGRAWLAWRGTGGRLQAGEYRFDRPASALEVFERLRRGDVLLHTVTLPEGLHLVEVAARVAEAGFGTEEELRRAFSDGSGMADLDPAAVDLEGYLFPDTYRFPRGQRPGAIARRMTQRFREVVGADYAERAASVGLTLRQAVTLASMIEEETSVAGERARISRVFHNRLERGMRMECDPTVVYALHREGRTVERLTYAHLRVESPWNTYVVSGLPAGPIANPGKASLEAAVEPGEGKALYFVAAPGGGHTFSNTFAEHRKAVAQWRRYSRSSR